MKQSVKVLAHAQYYSAKRELEHVRSNETKINLTKLVLLGFGGIKRDQWNSWG